MDSFTSPDWRHSAVLCIDMQRDFVCPTGACPVPGTAQVVPAIASLLQHARLASVPIVHVIRLYAQDGSNAELCRRRQIQAGPSIVAPFSQGADIAPDLLAHGHAHIDHSTLLNGVIQPIANQEWVMYKPRWGAFYSTDLEGWLHSQEVSTVIVCGCNYPNCPRTTIYEASERDFRVVLAENAISQLGSQDRDQMMGIGVNLWRHDDIAKAWHTGKTPTVPEPH